MKLFQDFKNYIKQNNLFNKGETLLLGVSGGPDSLTMLDLFYRLKEEYYLKLIVFHLNHRFRAEGVLEAEFVKKQADKFGLKAVIEEYDVPAYIKEKGVSPEEGARDIRFSLMKKYACKYKLKKISLGHNRDDLVETVFLNLLRGTGLKGLTGIAPLQSYGGLKIIRPLLNIYRHEIEEYCKEKHLEPVQDPSNKENIYTRNKLRNELIPYLEREINNGIKETIARMAENIKLEDDFMSETATRQLREIRSAKSENVIVLSLEKLSNLHLALRNRVIKKAIGIIKGDYTDLYSYHYQDLNKLILRGQTGKYIELPDGIRARRSYDKFILERDSGTKGDNIPFLYKLSIPGKVSLAGKCSLSAEVYNKLSSWKEISLDPGVCVLDLRKLNLPLRIRNRKPGDCFQPLGMEGFKKLKDYFIDEKIPAGKRDKIPLVVDNDDNIVWVAGHRMDERFKVSEETNKFLILRINYQEGD
ncbi:MAG TPA: tRNA lysidine(34) synthetase TilS [Halanaerobiales bacterium]|nr:tRNA lysidine(34) synthetase TilS [Halanaerobiales bacterium]